VTAPVQAESGPLYTSVKRSDGPAKAAGSFTYSGDLTAPSMLIARTLRSPHPSARIRRLDVSAARRLPGVAAVVTADDVPGRPLYGLVRVDQPVFATGEVRYVGEPIAAVAAVDAQTADRALAAMVVEYDLLTPLTDPELARDNDPFATLKLATGDRGAHGPVVVTGSYVVGMQDQAFLGPEAGLAVPNELGGVDLTVATQFLHSDRDQVALSLGLRQDQVRVTLGGVGGAFGGREDVTLHIHACLLAMVTGLPVRMRYSRAESFLAHPHRHPARLWYRHEAQRNGELVRIDATVLYDGGAYASTSEVVVANAACFAIGPYRVPNAFVDAIAVRTNNPPCGAMRGFGSPQVAIGHEAQMDKLAARIGIDPVELRLRNALEVGDEIITGQKLTGATPVREVILAACQFPLPETPPKPGLVRGVGFGLGFKNLMFSEAIDDFSQARVELALDESGVPLATVICACAEVGQGFVTIARQIAREELCGIGVERIVLDEASTAGIDSAGSTSASRQTWMSGGAVQGASQGVADLVRKLQRDRPDATLVELLTDGPIEHTCTFRHRPTERLDENGRGDAFVSFIYSAHRAVVDVDVELGTSTVIALTTGQDAGRVLNPLSVQGQLEGGTAQGVGLALFEELVLEDGVPVNAGFEDYVLPTTVDMPVVDWACVEQAEPDAPYGAKGIGEGPTISSTPAVLAAVRNATGLELPNAPIRPEDIALG
jgi:CO/xanthine dehydrogenase Mo-binding subunit